MPANKSYKNFLQGIGVIPKALTGSSKLGEIEALNTTNKLYFHNGTINDPIVQETVAATLTNKTLTAPVINNATADTITGIAGAALTLQSASNQNLSLQAQGTGQVLLESLSVNGSNISASTDVVVNVTGGAKTYFQVTGTNYVKIDNTGIAFLNTVAFNNENAARFYDTDNSNYVGIKSPAVVSGDYTITLPSAQPTANQALVYDGTQYKWGPAGGADAAGANDDILATSFRARILDSFDDVLGSSSSTLSSIYTTAQQLSANQLYQIFYDGTKTITGVATSMSLSAPATFVIKQNDLIIIGTEVRRIVSLASQVSFTIDAAFTTNPSGVSCIVSQAVASQELYQTSFDGASIASAFTDTPDFSEYLIDYQDGSSVIYAPNTTPLASYSVSNDVTAYSGGASTWSTPAVRPILQSSQLTSAMLPSAGQRLYVRFFSNQAGLSGSLYLFEYRAYMQKSPLVASGALNQAYARLDGSTTPQFCTLSLVSGKTRVILSWDYSVGVNGPSSAYGAIDVYINGQFIPRQVGSYLTAGAFYREIDKNTIELDTNYSSTPYAVQIIQRQPNANFTSSATSSTASTGSGLKNYLTTYNGNPGNGNFELGVTTGWALFNTTLTSLIPTGTVNTGAASITTFSVTSTTPLAGVYSLLAGSSGVLSAGQGFISDTFTIDREDRSKVLAFNFSYEVLSGTMNFSGTSSNTWAVYIYDVTNTTWIQPAGVYNLVQSSGVGYATGTFQTSSNSSLYRIAIVCINATSGAVSIEFDDFFVGPQISVNAPAINDLTSYTPIITTDTGTMTNYTATGKYRRVGDSIEAELTIEFTGAAGTWSKVSASLPSGLTGDTSKFSNYDVDKGIGTIQALDAGTTLYEIGSLGYNSATNKIYAQYVPTVNATSASTNEPVRGTVITNLVPFTFFTGDKIFLTYKLPIAGWSSNTVSSADTDTRVVAAKFNTLQSRTINNSGPAVLLENLIYDTHGAYNNSTGIYTVPVSGYYKISGYLRATAIALPNSNYTAFVLRLNGSILANSLSPAICGTRSSAASTYFPEATGSATFKLNAGDQLAFGGFSDTANTTYNDGYTCIEIERISGPAVAQAVETVACEYNTGVTANSLPNATGTFVDFGTKITDTHNAVVGAGSGNNTIYTNTWRYVVPVSGRYQVNSTVTMVNGAVTTSLELLLTVYVDGVNQRSGTRIPVGTSVSSGVYAASVSTVVKVNAGQVISLAAYQSNAATAARNQEANGVSNHISIVRVGN